MPTVLYSVPTLYPNFPTMSKLEVEDNYVICLVLVTDPTNPSVYRF